MYHSERVGQSTKKSMQRQTSCVLSQRGFISLHVVANANANANASKLGPKTAVCG